MLKRVSGRQARHSGPRRTFEGEEHEEGKVVARFCRVVDLSEEAEVRVGLWRRWSARETGRRQREVAEGSLTEGQVCVGHDIGEGVRDVPTGQDLPHLDPLVPELSEASVFSSGQRPYANEGISPTHEEEREDDATDKDPLADSEGDLDGALLARVVLV